MLIQKKDKRWNEYLFKIDTGSDVTFMNTGDCIDLGYRLKDCEERDYTNTNNEKYRMYLKDFNVKICDYLIKKVPIGFSAKPIKTLLLGRAGIFGFLNVCFDCKSKQTVIFTPDKT
jgi:hypothetical protein